MNHQLLLIIHLLCAAIWVGGHLYVAIIIIPSVLKSRNATKMLNFEKSFEPLGMPSLLILIITGIWMMYQFGVRLGDLFAFSTPIETAISLKVTFLLSTVALAISAQTWVLPSVRKSPKRIPVMAVHVILVALLGVALLTVGSFVSRGGL